MERNNYVKTMAATALLTSIGIIIPLFSPFKILIEPASFTLGSHVAIMMAMFISPFAALFVTIGTTVGFFLAAFPLTVVLRALSHIVFVLIGSIYLKNHKNIINDTLKLRLFSFIIGLIHALCEVLVITVFYFNGSVKGSYLYIVAFLVGICGIVHSLIDFEVSIFLTKQISKEKTIKPIFKNIYS